MCGVDEHLVSPSVVWLCSANNRITLSRRAGAIVIMSPGENYKQEVERIQEAGGHINERAKRRPYREIFLGIRRRDLGEGEEHEETVTDSGADKDKTETIPSETPRIANTVTEPDAQEQGVSWARDQNVPKGSQGLPQTLERLQLRRNHNLRGSDPSYPAVRRRITSKYIPMGSQPSLLSRPMSEIAQLGDSWRTRIISLCGLTRTHFFFIILFLFHIYFYLPQFWQGV